MNDDKDSALFLLDLVGAETLRGLSDAFEQCTGLPVLFADREGRPVIEPDDPARFCGSFAPGGSGSGASVCLCCRRRTAREWTVRQAEATMAQTGEPVIDLCPMGFLDAVVPIELDGKLIGYGAFGRALESAPDLEQYRRLAVENGLDPEACVAAASGATVMPRDRLVSAARLLHTIAGLVVRAANDTRQARRIQELEKTRDDLTHMIVHDLRTPLTAVIGSLQTMHDGSLGSLDDLVKELVGLSLRSSKRLLGMVNDLLDVSKTEAGQMALNREPAQLRGIVDGAMEQVQYLAEERGVALAVDVPPDLPALYADRGKVDRVLVNLVANAVKFTPRGGSVSVFASYPGDEQVLVGVRDTGEGIPEEYRDRIFEKFGQVESRKAGRKMSTGLGLTFCKMAVEAHGGRIWLESKVGEGTTFFFTLPTP